MSLFLGSIYRKAGQLSLKQMLLICGIIIVIIVIIARSPLAEAPQTADEATTSLPRVSLTSLNRQSETNTISLIGTVRADAEAGITAEVSGQVTAVPVTLGAPVQQGSIIATLENRSELAAITQAEGAYDAAVAAASQGDLSLDTAEQSLERAKQQAITTVKNTYTILNSTVKNNIDTFFSQPNTSSVPGLRIDGETSYLNSARVELQTILPTFAATTNQLTTRSDLTAVLQEATAHTEFVLTMVNSFLVAFDRSENMKSERFDIAAEKATFTNLRTNLINTLQSLEEAKNAIESAQISVQQAKQGTLGSTNSSADAQVKQALGSLQAAQANLAKTILRSPIAGTVTALDVRSGNFVNAGTKVATIANTNALEIITYAGTDERNRFAVGDTVRLDGDATGRVAAVSPTINTETGKTEIRIYSDSTDITSGDSVRITTTPDTSVPTSATTFIPITAVKFTSDKGAVLVVDVDNIVRAQAVELGAIRAGQVEVRSGLDADDLFISDARGISVGDEVTVEN